MTETIDTWTIAMESALACVPADLRLDVLRKLTDGETERRRHPFLIGWKKRWHAVDEATSVIVQVLVRDIGARDLARHRRDDGRDRDRSG